jgi:hypothetical protein
LQSSTHVRSPSENDSRGHAVGGAALCGWYVNSAESAGGNTRGARKICRAKSLPASARGVNFRPVVRLHGSSLPLFTGSAGR